MTVWKYIYESIFINSKFLIYNYLNCEAVSAYVYTLEFAT